MYNQSSQRLDTPPPASQFRRPFSPEPFDPMPMSNYSLQHLQPHLGNHPQREPSDISVEALDLADYARTLRPYVARNRRAEIAQQDDYYHQQEYYLPSPPPRHSLESSRVPPSLVSRGGTLSSNSHASFSQTRSPRRPFSLPAPAHHSTPRIVQDYDYDLPQADDTEIDIARFPAWSRNWYDDPYKNSYKKVTSPDIIAKPSPFDPGYSTLHHGRTSNAFSNTFPQSDASYSYAPPYSSLHGADFDRDVLPWGVGDPPEYGAPLDPDMKEERYRMLEREFGPNAAKSKLGKESDFLDENGKPLVGTVDAKGNIVTQGPKKRTAVRVLQLLLALTAAIPAIYAALVIKPKGIPPPASKPPAFVLYIISCLTFFVLLYLFVFRPCCCRGKRAKAGKSGPMANGMMILPVQGLPGGKKGKQKPKEKKGKHGKYANQSMGDVQVNLIVDPSAFGNNQEESSDDEDIDGTENLSAYDTHRKRKRQKRRSVFAGLAMEEKWKRARAWLKKLAAFDVIAFFIWAITFVFILIGKRCPTGGFEGWCNAYNVSSAAACLLCVMFGFSAFFDIKDLNTSKVSPRTRT